MITVNNCLVHTTVFYIINDVIQCYTRVTISWFNNIQTVNYLKRKGGLKLMYLCCGDIISNLILTGLLTVNRFPVPCFMCFLNQSSMNIPLTALIHY